MVEQKRQTEHRHPRTAQSQSNRSFADIAVHLFSGSHHHALELHRHPIKVALMRFRNP